MPDRPVSVPMTLSDLERLDAKSSSVFSGGAPFVRSYRLNTSDQIRQGNPRGENSVLGRGQHALSQEAHPNFSFREGLLLCTRFDIERPYSVCNTCGECSSSSSSSSSRFVERITRRL